MKLNKAKLKKEFETIGKLLGKQKQERAKVLLKCSELKRGWKYCWGWDESAFLDDCSNEFEYLIHDFENHDIKIK